MNIEIKVPQLSESVAEATLVTWHKQPGEAVKEGENLIDIETDKVVLELPAIKSGVLTKILKKNGDKVTSNEVIAMLDTEAKASVQTAAQPAVAAKAQAAGAVAVIIAATAHPAMTITATRPAPRCMHRS